MENGSNKEIVGYLYAVDFGYSSNKTAIVKIFEDGTKSHPETRTTSALLSPISKDKASRVNADQARNLIYSKSGDPYFIGEADADSDKAVPTLDFGFIKEYAGGIISKDLENYGIDFSLPIKVVTGLTILDGKHAKEFESVFKNDIKKPDGSHLEFKAVQALAQGHGVLLDYFSNNTSLPPLEESGTSVVIDMGLRTLDFMVYRDGKFLQTDSWANETMGIGNYIGIIQDAMQKMQNNEYVGEIQASKALKEGSFKVYGKIHSVEEAIMQFIKSYVTDLSVKLSNSQRATLRKADRIILAGGGANIVTAKAIQEYGSGAYAQCVEVNDPKHLSNVRGYLAAPDMLGILKG